VALSLDAVATQASVLYSADGCTLTSVDEINDGEMIFFAACGELFTGNYGSPQTAKKSTGEGEGSDCDVAGRSKDAMDDVEGSSAHGSIGGSGGNAIVWIRDEDRDSCSNSECGKSFTLILRRKHCRSCGDIFCRACIVPKRTGSKGQKVCVGCAGS
jgi:hypothetical protein